MVEQLLDPSRSYVPEGEYALADGFGSLSVQHYPSETWKGLSSLCASSKCTLFGSPLGQTQLTPLQANILNPGAPEQQLYLSKTPDSLVFSTLQGGIHHVAALLHDPNMYVPSALASPGQPSVVVRVVQPEGGSVHLTEEHDVRPPHCVSRCCSFKHIVQQLMAMQPPDDTPREVFSSPNMGSVTVCMLHGQKARALRERYLAASGFNQEEPVENDICQLLQLKQASAKMLQCKNGLLLYRDRKSNNTKTLVALINSLDTIPGARNVDPESPVQVHRFVYSNAAKAAGFRFTIVPGACTEDHQVSETHTPQDILSRVCHHAGNLDLQHVLCHDFVAHAAGEQEDNDNEELSRQLSALQCRVWGG